MHGDWEIELDGRRVHLTDASVRDRLAKEDLTGAELARQDEGPWRPLHTFPVFTEIVPHGDAARTARDRALQPFLSHLAAFVGVVGFISLTGDPPFWAVWWGIGLVAHGLQTWSQIGKMRDALHAAPPAIGAAPPAIEASPAALSDELARAFERLGVAAIRRPEVISAVEVAALRRQAEQLANDRELFAESANPEEIGRLREEEAATEAQLAQSTELVVRDALTQQLAFLRLRLEMLAESAETLRELDAKERSLIHQVETLRLGLLGTARSAGVDLGEQVARLRADLETEREVRRALISPGVDIGG